MAISYGFKPRDVSCWGVRLMARQLRVQALSPVDLLDVAGDLVGGIGSVTEAGGSQTDEEDLQKRIPWYDDG